MKIPLCVLTDPLDKLLASAGWILVARGKVRHTYFNMHFPGKLLVLATNRVSVFDFVLPALVRFKGDVLTAMNVLMFTRPLQNFPSHLVAFGAGIDEYLPQELCSNADLQSRAIIVEHLEMIDVEGVVRGYLTGSGWKTYKWCVDNGKPSIVCGHLLPEGLRDGSELPEPIFTPTSKAQTGHDEPLDHKEVSAKYGTGVENLCLSLYKAGRDYAKTRGIILADTKFELGYVNRLSHRRLTVGDEVFTPDSSRFWPYEQWVERLEKGQSPPSMDKQFVRDELKRIGTPFIYTGEVNYGDKIVGINDLRPENRRHRQFVGRLEINPKVLEQTTGIYLECIRRLADCDLDTFKRETMGIKNAAAAVAA